MPSSGSKTVPTHRKDKIEAFKCYKKASDLGNPRGMNNSGLMLETGFEGMAADPERACQLYRQAHKLGNLDATINLAFYYLNVSVHKICCNIPVCALSRDLMTRILIKARKLC